VAWVCASYRRAILRKQLHDVLLRALNQHEHK
jgi:hypothetical protein